MGRKTRTQMNYYSDEEYTDSDEEYIDLSELPSVKECNLFCEIQDQKFEKEKDFDFDFFKFVDTYQIFSLITNRRMHNNPDITLNNRDLEWYFNIISLVLDLDLDDIRWTDHDIQFMHNTLKNNKFYINGIQRDVRTPPFVDIDKLE